MNYSKAEIQSIISNAPAGHPAGEVVQALVNRGDKIEGLNYTQADGTLRPFSIPGDNVFYSDEQPQQQSPFWQLTENIASPIREFTKGAVKEVGQELYNVGKFAEDVKQALPGSEMRGRALPEQTPDILRAKNLPQQIGKGATAIGTSLLPETKISEATKAVDVGVEGMSALQKLAQTNPTIAKVIDFGLKAIGKGGIRAGEGAALATAQSGKEAAGTGAIIGGLGGVLGQVADTFGQQLATSLQKSALRLTPTKQSELAGRLDQTAKYITENIGAGTNTQQYNKAVNMISSKEDQLQNFLDTEAKGITPLKKTITDKLNTLKTVFNDERDSLTIDKQIDDAIKTINAKQGDVVSLSALNKFKRSTFQNAYNKTGTKVLDWVEAYIGNTIKDVIQDSTQGLTINGQAIGDFNQEYGQLLQARNLLKMSKSKEQLGLSGKALLLLLGGQAGGLPGEIAGYAAGKLSGLTSLGKTGLGALARGGATTAPLAGEMAVPFISGENQPQ